MTGLAELPRPARYLVAGALPGSIAIAVAVAAFDGFNADLLTAGAIAVGMVAGELFRVVLPYRHSSGVRFTLSDAALMCGVLAASPASVVLGVSLGVIAWQVVDRAEPVKLAYNFAQLVASTSVAVAVLAWLGGWPGAAPAFGTTAFAAALAVFLAVNTVAVAGIVALTAGHSLRATTRRMLPTNALVTGCNGALALLAVVVWEQNPFVLPALAAPLLLIYVSGRQRVAAQLDRERSQAFVAVDHRLAEARSAPELAEILTDGVGETLAVEGAVWRRGMWMTRVPPGSRECPVEEDAGELRWGDAVSLGPAVSEGLPGCAVAFDHGVLVVWQGTLAPSQDTGPWLERLAGSASVHFARVEAQAALEQERGTLRAVVDGTADGILVVDEAGRIAVWNPAMRRLSGEDDAVGRPVEDVLGKGPWDQAGVHDVVRPARGEDEARVWRLAVAAPAGDATTGRLRVAVVHDVTEERRVTRMKDDMLAVVSHELRTPLTPIKASAQLLSRRADRLDPAQRQRLLDQIEQRADHLARLVEDMILVAQLSSSAAARPRVVPATADLVAVVGDELRQVRETHPDHALHFDGPDTLVGTTDALRLRQIVGNLIDNACKYSPTGTEVTVVMREVGNDVRIDVRDQGRGIPMEERERVFERFERLEDPLRMTTSGAGLGLFIVRALTRALSGEVSIIDGVEVGTTVRLQLPLLGVAETAVGREEPILRHASSQREIPGAPVVHPPAPDRHSTNPPTAHPQPTNPATPDRHSTDSATARPQSINPAAPGRLTSSSGAPPTESPRWPDR